MAHAEGHAHLQPQGHHDRLGDDIEIFDLIDAHSRDGPASEATELQEYLCHRHPVWGASGRAEPKGRRVGLGLVPSSGVHQAHSRLQPVNHGQEHERGDVRGHRRALLGNEGCVALGHTGWPLTRSLHLAQNVRQPAQPPVGKRKLARLHPCSPKAEGFMQQSPLRRR